MIILRRVSQVCFLAIFLFLFVKARFPYSGNLPSDLFLRFSPLSPLFYLIADLRIPPFLWPGLLVLFFTIFFGRFFCGWICPLGTTLDIFRRFLGSGNKSEQNFGGREKYFKYMILLAAITFAMFSMNFWAVLDPLSIFNRTLTIVIFPFFSAVFSLTKDLVRKTPIVSEIFGGLLQLVQKNFFPEGRGFFLEVFSIGGLFILVLWLEKMSSRFWCRNICPAGAVLGIFSRFKVYNRNVNSACKMCGICTSGCKMGSIPEKTPQETLKTECIQCMSCGKMCPMGESAVSFKFGSELSPVPTEIPRRYFLKTFLGSMLGAGMGKISLDNPESRWRLIRPPGALPEPEFLQKCIRCMECVRICQSNGGCLQPDQNISRLSSLWSPIAVMRTGYCEFNCNLCGKICPTRSIVELSIEVKRKKQMGIAYFDKNLCIPYTRNENCLVCEEHCPTPKKAIKFELREVSLEGTLKKVMYPFVDRNLCIGCGICETKCPIPGKSGIIVVNEKPREPRLPSQSGRS